MLEARICYFKSQEGELHIVKNSISVMRGIRHKSLYFLDVETVIGESESNLVDESMLWHARLGHVDEKGLNELLKQVVLKHHKKFAVNVNSPLDYVHAGLWGPSRTETIGGGRYFLSLMGHYSRKLWLYNLKSKSDCYTKFVEWYNIIKNEKGIRLKCLRTDNGLEFMSEEFHKFCVDKWMKRHKIVHANRQ